MMQRSAPVRGAYLRLLVAWVDFAVRRPRLVLALVAASVVASAVYTAEYLHFNSDTSQLVHQDAPFRRNYRSFNRVFPHYDRMTLIVLSAANHRLAADAARRLTRGLRARPDLFGSVYAADEGDFLEDNAFLYLDRKDLEGVLSRLAEAEPVLAALAQDPSLRGLFRELSSAVEALGRGETLSPGFARVANRVAEVGERLLAGERTAVDWDDDFFKDEPGEVHHLVIVQGQEEFSAEISSAALVASINEIAVALGLVPDNGVRVRLTGMVPLGYEELVSARASVRLAAVITFVLLTVIMTFGVRSLRVILSTLATVVVGIFWTSAFAVASVGELNAISMTFGVLLIGLGVDFTIHLCLRALEGLADGLDTATAVRQASEAVGIAISLCALTSCIGFLSFVPTDYRGLAELGIISSGGLVCAVIGCLTVAPAILVLMGTPKGQPATMVYSSGSVSFLIRRARWIGCIALLLAVAASGPASRMVFNFSTLGMKDPNCESMTTLRELQDAGILTDYSVMLVAPDLAAARALALRLESLAVVEEVRTPEYYLPAEQDEKLEQLEDAALFMWPALRAVDAAEARPPPTAEERLTAIERLRTEIAGLPDAERRTPAGMAATRLALVLDRMLAAPDGEALAADLEQLTLGDLEERLDWLRRVLGAERIGLDDLPEALRRRLISEDGQVLLSVLPSEDVSDVQALRRFIAAVETVSSNATGRPVVEAGVGAIVVSAFYQAVTIALFGIVLVLLLTLGDVMDTVLVLLPLFLAAIFTVATAVLLDTPFNMINIISIPLILGLGVDNGIHIVLRVRRENSLAAVLASSTPRAIILSCLTTLSAFGALAVSSHQGIRSMGVLLSIAFINLLICTLIVLPALLAWRAGSAALSEVEMNGARAANPTARGHLGEPAGPRR